MTIVVGVASPDGLVLAGDSRTTRSDGDRTRIASDNSCKVFSVGSRWAVATYGVAFVGESTIDGLMTEFIAHIGDEAPQDVDLFSAELGKFFTDRFEAALAKAEAEWDVETQGWALGFLVAGYDTQGVGQIGEVLIPGGVQPEESRRTTLSGGVMWRGQTDVIRRLIHGIDWGELALQEIDLDEEKIEELHGLHYQLEYPITVQDAVDFATFLVHTTIDMQRFSDGWMGRPGEVPGCGGPVQVLAVTRSGTRWVTRNELRGPSAPGRAEGASAD